jgi:hydroxyacylglutathione hydrolase
MLKIATIVVTPFAQNCRVVWCSETQEGVVVDPGGEVDEILRVVEDNRVLVRAIWLTHAHLDHCAGVAPLLEKVSVPLFAHADEKTLRGSVSTIARMYGLPASEWLNCPEPDILLRGGEVVAVGNQEAEVRFAPGHSPGHVVFYFESQKIVLAGDTLFAGSIGRTDLPGGNHSQLLTSVREALMTLPDETEVLSGHGEDTTIGRERRSNPFLKG